jgi:pimeloyl-ACP methyl ester carboxylesterase
MPRIKLTKSIIDSLRTPNSDVVYGMRVCPDSASRSRRRAARCASSTATTVMPTRDVTIGDTFVRISGQGFPLVFVHGFTTTSEFWREQAEEFSKAYRVIRINLPGHGASPAPTSRSYCLQDFVEDVARVFRGLT